MQMEKDYRDKEDLHYSTLSAMRTDLNDRNSEAREKNVTNRGLYSENEMYKRIMDEKNLEISKLKMELGEYLDHNTKVIKEKQKLMSELDTVKDIKSMVQRDVERLKDTNLRLLEAKAIDNEKMKEKDLTYGMLLRKFDESTDEMLYLQNERKKLDNELDIARAGRRVNASEVDKLLMENTKLQDSQKQKSEEVKDLEFQLRRNERRLGDTNFLLRKREDELAGTKGRLTEKEIRAFEAAELARKAEKEKQTLETLANYHRRDADAQKKLKEEERLRNLQLSEQRKRLERDVLDKELEGAVAKRELAKVSEAHDGLLDDNYYLSQEVSAYRSHADVLQTQNRGVIHYFYYLNLIFVF